MFQIVPGEFDPGKPLIDLSFQQRRLLIEPLGNKLEVLPVLRRPGNERGRAVRHYGIMPAVTVVMGERGYSATVQLSTQNSI